MSWLKQYPLICRNWVKFLSRLSFIRPYSTCRNWERSLQRCFVLRGDSAPACSWFRTRPLLPLQIKPASQTPTTIVSSLTVALVDVSCCRLLIGQSGKDPRTEHSTRTHKSLAEMVWTLSNGAEIRTHKEAEAFCHQAASEICPASSHPLVKLSSNLPEKSKEIFPRIAAISASPKRLSLTNTDMQPHFLLKRKEKVCCYPGALQRDIAANKQSYSQPPVSSSLPHLILCFTTGRQPEKWEEYGPADSITGLLGRNLNKVLK